MNTDQLKEFRPEPLPVNGDYRVFNNSDDVKEIAVELSEGNLITLGNHYPSGLKIVSELKNVLSDGETNVSFDDYRSFRSVYHEASNRLLVPVKDNKVALKKSPEIGWLEKLYPDQSDFYLPFPKIQGLNSAWQWYINGIDYPGVPGKIHPWYGVYFPTRKDHLYLFNYWLRKYSGPKELAIDIGTGCGVLAFQMMNSGIDKVEASDLNPVAVHSAAESAKSLGFEDRMTVYESDLFENVENSAPLIVFNPPWLPVKTNAEGLDKAIYFEPGLFERFFEEAVDHMTEDGKLILIFSNLGREEGQIDIHPVEDELENGSRFKKVKLIKRKAEPSSGKTRRRDNRKNEYVELWELGKR